MIRRFEKEDHALLLQLLRDEGEEWQEYYGAAGQERFLHALLCGVAYVIFEGGILCGYIRCREDDGFGVYVYDLLVAKSHRGRQLGKQLLERVYHDYPDQNVYVMSDVDPYYQKLGYAKIGSVFQVKGTSKNSF